MSAAAIMLVKDEADVIAWTLNHLLGQVDKIIVADNGSTDGTREILDEWAVSRVNGEIEVIDDGEIGYWQSKKTTRLADRARQQGYDWVLPCDADEMWVAADRRPIRDFLLGVPADIGLIRATLFNYLPTAQDPAAENPFERIGWRLAEHGALPKVCCRTWPGLTIEAGNHGAHYGPGDPGLVSYGLRVNHYSWRSAEQYARKIRNGARAYAATDLPEGFGAHWRMWGDPDAPDLAERAGEHFRQFFWAGDPPFAPGSTDPRSLVYDPAA